MTVGAHDAVTLGCYALGVLDAHERRGVEQHLSWCAQCRAQVADFSRVRIVLDGIPREALIEELRPSERVMPSELVLQRALRQIRSEGATRGIPTPRASPPTEVVEQQPQPGQHRRSRVPVYLAAAAVVAAMVLGAGAVVYGSGMSEETPTAQPQEVFDGGVTRTIVNSDAKSGVRLVADLTAIHGWVKVDVKITGIPAGENCQLIVVGKDGTRDPVKGWVSTEKHRVEGWSGGGNTSIRPKDVKSIFVETDDGKRLVTAQVA